MKQICPTCELLTARPCAYRQGTPHDGCLGPRVQLGTDQDQQHRAGSERAEASLWPLSCRKRLPAGEAGDRKQDFFSTQGKLLSGMSGMGWQGWEPQPFPTLSLLLGKAAFILAKGGAPPSKVPWQSGFTVNCLQPELRGLGPGTPRSRPHTRERAGLMRQAGLGSNLGLGTSGQVNSSTSCKGSEPKLVRLGNWANRDLSELPRGFKKVTEDTRLAGCLTGAATHLGVPFSFSISSPAVSINQSTAGSGVGRVQESVKAFEKLEVIYQLNWGI